jgi:hypothetical protein
MESLDRLAGLRPDDIRHGEDRQGASAGAVGRCLLDQEN